MIDWPPPPRRGVLNAPPWRKLLAVRVFLLYFAEISVSFFLIDWLDVVKPDIPEWMEAGIIILAVLPFLFFLMTLKEGITDLVAHFVPEGRIKRLLLWGDDRLPVIRAKEFEDSVYINLIMPIIIPLAAGILVLIALLLFGGMALMDSMFSPIFSGWPSWAVVIIFLLLAILLK